MSIERELLKSVLDGDANRYWTISSRLARKIEEVLAQPEQTEQEPVAWIIETEIEGKLSEWVCTDKKHYMEAHDGAKDPIPLYTAPPKREPLGLEIMGVCGSEDYREGFKDGVIYAEKCHDIGGGE